MATPKILIKRSNVAGRVPTSLDSGELALNTADGKIYYTGHDGAIHAFIDSAGVNTLINNSVSTLDSGNVTDMIDSDYIQARQITYTIPTLGNDFVDSAQVQAIINAAYVKNIIDSAYVAGIVETDGDITITITNEITSTVDSAYVQARVDATDFLDSAEAIALIDSAHVRGKIDTTFINSLNVNSTTLDGENGDHYLDYNNFTNTPTILDNIDVQNQIDSDYVQLRQEKFDTSDFTDSAYVKARIDSAISDLIGGAPEALNTLNELAEALNDDSAAFDTLLAQIDARLDSAEATALIDSAYIRARQIKYLDSDAVKLITLDSSEIPGIVDQAYVRARQDFRYSELSGTPTSLSDFSNDILATTDDLGEGTTNLYFTNDRVRAISLDSEDATNLIDSAYIQARQAAAVAEGTDSATVRDIIDSHGNSKFLRLEGGTLTGHLNVDGSNKIYFNDSDGFIGWTGSLLNIRQNNASLRLTNNSFQLVNTSSLGLITADTNSVGLRYAGNTKLQTETDGITVTGTLNNHTLPGGTGGTYALTSDIPTVPTNVSDFTNDANYLDSTTVQDVIDSAYVLARAPSQDFLDSSEAIALIDSAHVQARQITYSNADFLDSNTIEGVVDSAYVQLRQTAQDFSYTSLTDVPDLFDSSDAETLIDSAYVQLRQTAQDFAYSSLTDAPTTVSSFTNDANYLDSTTVLPLIPKFGTDYVDSSTVIDIINSEGLDSDLVIALVDSAYIQLRDRFQDSSLVTSTVDQTYIRDRETPNPVLGTDFVDSAEALKLIDANALDSARAISLIDSAYVQLRQDYAYGSLTGTPTIPAFGTDFVDSAYVDDVLPKFGTDYVDSAFVTSQGYITSSSLPVLGTDFVDSAEALKLIDANALDSARATSLIDSAYIELRRPPETIFGVTNNGASAYTFNGDGFSSGRDNPDLYLQRGKTYKFEVAAIGHPFQIRSSAGGMAYNNGVTNNGSENDNVFFTPDMNAPDTLVYQCTNHASMVGTIYIVDINTFVDSAYVEGVLPKFGTDYVDSAFVTGQGYITSSSLPVLGTDFIDSAEALKLIDANALDSARAITLIDSAYIQARQTAGTDSAATIALIEATVDSAYVQARQTAGGGGDGTVDSAQTIALIQSTVDSAYIQLRVDSDYEKPIEQQIFIYTADSGQTTFADSDDNGNVLSFTHHQQVTIYLNGLLLSGTGDATIDNSTDTITLTDAADSGDIVTIVKLSGSKPHIDSSMINNIDLQLITYVFTADSNESAFEGTDDRGNTMILSGNERVSINGILLLDSDDYSVLNNKVTLVSATDSGDIVTIERFKGRDAALDSSLIANTELIFTTFKFTADSGDTVFTGADDNGNTLSYSSGKVRVHLNGILLIDSDDYTATSNTTLTLTQSTNTGDIVTIEKMSGRDVGVDSADVRLIVDSAYIQARVSSGTGTDSATVSSIIEADVDSAYVQARQITYTIPTLGTDFIDSAEALKLIDANALDSSRATSLIDSAYVQLRQDYAYASLTGTPTIPAFGTDYVDSATVVDIINSEGLDSDLVTALVDSAYIQLRDRFQDSSLVTSTVNQSYVRNLETPNPVLGTDFVDSAQVELIVDSSYINSRIDFDSTSANQIIAMNSTNTGFVSSGMIYNSTTQSLGIGVDSAGSIDARLHIVGTGTANTGETLFKVNNSNDHDRIEFIDENTSTSMPSALRIKLPTEGMGIISETGPVRIFQGGSTTSDVVARFHSSGNTFNDAYKFPNADGTTGQFLKTNGEGVLSFDSVAAGQSLALGTDYVDSAQVELIIDSSYVRGKLAPTFTFGSNDSATVADMQVTNRLSLGGAGSQFFAFNEDTVKVKFANWYSSNDRQYGMGQLWYETFIAAIDEYNLGPEQRRIGFYLEVPDAGASDTENGSGKHPSNARMYISDSGMHVSYSNPFRLNESGGPNYIELAGAQTLASNVTLTLPTTTGTLARTADIPALGADFIDSNEALILIDANALDSGRATSLIDSAYVQARQTSGLSDIVNDTTPQLGGNLDGNGFDIFLDDDDILGWGGDPGRTNIQGKASASYSTNYIKFNVRTGFSTTTEIARFTEDDGLYTTIGLNFANFNSGINDYYDLKIKGPSDGSLVANETIRFPDSSGTVALTKDVLDSADVIGLIPTLGTDFIDSDQALILIDANALDSGRATSLIDSAYIELRRPPETIFNVVNNGASAYTFTGDGFSSGRDNPDLYLQRGKTYKFVVAANGHPFQIRSSAGGSAYNNGVTNNGSENDNVFFTPDMNAPDTLVYQCTNHGSMVGTIYIVDINTFVDSSYVTDALPVLGTDFIDSAQALILIDANALDSGRATALIDSAYIQSRQSLIDSALTTSLIDSAYIQARQTAGTDSAATIALIESTVDSAYVQLREAAGGGSGGTDSAAVITLIQQTVDSSYVQVRETSGVVSSTASIGHFIYTADSGQTAFTGPDDYGNTLSYTANSNNISVFLNGILQLDSVDFTETSNSTVTLPAVDSGDIVSIVKYTLTSASELDSAEVIQLIDSDYIQARQTAGTDSAATISLVEATVDSAYVQARQSGSTGLDSAQSLALFSAHGMTVNTFVYTADSIGKLVYEGTDDNLNVMSFTKASKNFRVSLNGILLIDSDDFTAVDNKITLINAPNVNDILAVETFSGTQGVGGMSTFRYTATNGQLTFSGSDVNGASLNYKPGDLIVSLNGITLIDSAEYTATDGTSIVLNDSAAVNDELLISTFTPDIERKWTERSTSISVGSNTKNIIDCSSGSVTLTFPSNPTFGDEIRVIDGTGNASTNNIIINRNGNNIQGAADNFIIDIDRAGVGFVYYNATNGWILIEN